MTVTEQCTVIVHLRPKPAAEERLLSIRDQMIDEFRDGFAGFVSATLARVDGGNEWRDIVVFADRAAADAAHVETPVYREWSSLVDIVSYETLERIAYHEAVIS